MKRRHSHDAILPSGQRAGHLDRLPTRKMSPETIRIELELRWYLFPRIR
ncbi:MAG: hypothetical protein AAFY57_07330 [Cyanobacteria bacterium J06642_2]